MSDMPTMSPAPRRVSFLRAGQHELAKLNRGLKRLSQEALDVLSDQLRSEDEKTRFKAAELLLSYHVSVSKQISDDDMARAIAEIKFAGGSTNDIGNMESLPVVDFDNLIET